VAAIASSPLAANIASWAFIWAMGKSAIAAIIGDAAAIRIHNVRTGDDKKINVSELTASIVLGLAIGGLSYFASKAIYVGYVMHGYKLAHTLLTIGVAGFFLSILSVYLGIIIRQSEKLKVVDFQARNITLYSLFLGLITWSVTTGITVRGNIVEAAIGLKKKFKLDDIVIIAALSAMNALRRLEN
jgi:H+/Cl- antiporter ClcA